MVINDDAVQIAPIRQRDEARCDNDRTVEVCRSILHPIERDAIGDGDRIGELNRIQQVLGDKRRIISDSVDRHERTGLIPFQRIGNRDGKRADGVVERDSECAEERGESQ